MAKRGSNRPSALPTQRASRHHGGAARGKMGTEYRFEPRKILSRYPTQNRRDQARQQLAGGPAAFMDRLQNYGGLFIDFH